MSKFFVYKLTVDNGGAPCVTEDLLTLGICKPSTRSAANLRDWIFGFMDNKGGNKLIYIAEVTGKMIGGAYYGTKAFHSRADSMYLWTPGDRLVPKKNPAYHGSRQDALKDIGKHPDYRRANVLLSTNFRYFGSTDCKVKVPENLAEGVRKVGQGHQSDALLPLRPAFREFRDLIWKEYFTAKKLGQPLNPKDKSKCHGGKHATC